MEKGAFVFLFVLAVVTPLFFLESTKSNFLMPKQWLWEPAAAFVALIWGFSVLFRKKLSLPRSRVYLSALVFLIILALSWVSSTVPYRSEVGFGAMAGAALGGLLGAVLVNNRLRALSLLAAVSLVGCFQAVMGISQVLGMDLLFSLDSRETIGILGNSNYFGAFQGLVLPVTFCMGAAGWRLATKKASRWGIVAATTLAFLLITVSLVLSECQGAYISTAVAFLLLGIVRLVREPGRAGKIILWMSAAGVVLVAIAVISASLAGNVPLKRFAHLGDRAVGGRLLMWGASMNTVNTYPLLGSGLGTYRYNYLDALRQTLEHKDVYKIRHIIQNVEKPHNAYVQFWSESGSLGLAAFIVLVALFFMERVKYTRKIPDSPDFWVHAGAVASLFGFCALLFVSSVMEISPLREYFWLFMGLGLSTGGIAGAPSNAYEIDFSRAALPKQAMAALLLVLVPSGWFLYSFDRNARHYKGFTLWQEGITVARDGKLDAAVDRYDRALKIIPRNMKLLFYRGSAIIKLSENVEDEKLKSKLLKAGATDLFKAMKGYSDVNLYSNLGKALLDLGMYEESVNYYKMTASTGLNYVDSHVNLGLALTYSGKYDRAVKSFKKALKAKPDSIRARFNLATTLMKAERFKEAERHFRKLIGQLPKNPDVLNNLGIALMEQGAASEAVKYYRRALELDPESIRGHNNLGVALYKLGKKEEAIRQWRQVLEIDPENTVARDNLKKYADKSQVE